MGRRLFAEHLPIAGGEVTRPPAGATDYRGADARHSLPPPSPARQRPRHRGLDRRPVRRRRGEQRRPGPRRCRHRRLRDRGDRRRLRRQRRGQRRRRPPRPQRRHRDGRQRRPARRGGCVRSRLLVAGRERRHPDRRVGPRLVEHIRLHRSGRHRVDRSVPFADSTSLVGRSCSSSTRPTRTASADRRRVRIARPRQLLTQALQAQDTTCDTTFSPGDFVITNEADSASATRAPR